MQFSGLEISGLEGPPDPAAVDRPAGRVIASPLARRSAAMLGVELPGLRGSGPGGRVVDRDVRAAHSQSGAVPSVGTEAADPRLCSCSAEPTRVSMTRVQRLIAQRMVASQAAAPTFTVQEAVDMSACVELRQAMKRMEGSTPVPSFNDLVLRACALALREHPRANASVEGHELVMHHRINVGFAVALDAALVVPTLFDIDRCDLWEIAQRTRDLAERAWSGLLRPDEISGGTFTVSNLGMLGVQTFDAILNPPQVAILTVGEVSLRPAVHGGEVVPRHLMELQLTCDHRALYGADAAGLLGVLRRALEEPLALVAPH